MALLPLGPNESSLEADRPESMVWIWLTHHTRNSDL